MFDTVVHSARSFAEFYGISRERLARIIAISRRDRGGVFGLAGYGYFVADLVAPKRMEIRPYTPTRAEADAIPFYPIKGTFDPAPSSAPAASQADSAPTPGAAAPHSTAADSDTPSKFELECRILAERATALRQKNVLEQARLRDETVSYCSSAVQILLRNLRSDIDSLHLDPASSARLRQAIDAALSDLASVLPSIIAGTPVDRIELELSARRADRLSGSSRAWSASAAELTPSVEGLPLCASEAERTSSVEDLSSPCASAAERTSPVEDLSS